MNTADSNVTRGAVWTGEGLSNGETRELISRELGVTQQISSVYESGTWELRIEEAQTNTKPFQLRAGIWRKPSPLGEMELEAA